MVGGTVYASAVVVGYSYLLRSQGEKTPCSCSRGVDSPHRAEQFHKIASTYDDSIGRDELFMGINVLRRFLLRHARGNVLEVGAGTGRNLPYYDLKHCKRIVLTDASDQMLQQARLKLTSPQQRKQCAVLQQDASTLTTSALPTNGFDTVVDTFGLCSFDDPVQALREMQQMVKPDGRILLLEHGRSKTWGFVTRHLDQYADQHASNWGCVWNRDLDAILEQAGLEVDYKQLWHFGTTYYLICRRKTS